MTGLLIPARRRVRQGRPSSFVMTDKRWDFISFFNITNDGVGLNAAHKSGNRFVRKSFVSTLVTPDVGTTRTGEAIGTMGSFGTYGAAVGAQSSGSIAYQSFLDSSGANYVVDTNEYTIIALYEPANWYLTIGQDMLLFRLGNSPAIVKMLPGSTNYLVAGVDDSAYKRSSYLSPSVFEPRLVIARCIAGSTVKVSSTQLGHPIKWLEHPNVAEPFVFSSFARTRIGGAPGAIYFGGVSARALSDDELYEITSNVGVLWEPEDEYVGKTSGGFADGVLHGLDGVHNGAASVGAISVAHHPRFYIATDTALDIDPAAVNQGVMHEHPATYALFDNLPLRIATGNMHTSLLTFADLEKEEIATRPFVAECGTDIAFSSSGIRVSALAVETETAVSSSGGAIQVTLAQVETGTGAALSAGALAVGYVQDTMETEHNILTEKISSGTMTVDASTHATFSNVSLGQRKGISVSRTTTDQKPEAVIEDKEVFRCLT